MNIDWAAAGVIVAFLTGLAGVIFAGLAYRANTRESVHRDGEWRGQVDADRTNFKEFMTEIRKELRDIRRAINDILLRLPPAPTVGSTSPLSLTELGSTISKELDAAAWARDTATSVQPEVESKDAYGIQEFCFTYADKKDVFTPELLRAMRESAYQHGIDEHQVRRVFAIELRDKLLGDRELADLD